MSENTEKKLNVYTLYVNGVFGRNRKPKLESFELLAVPVDAPAELQPSVDTIKASALKRMELEKVKPGAKFKVAVQEETHTFRPDGSRLSRSFMVFESTDVLSWQNL